ncbi:DUF4132 domain-containing protein [Streptomonospora sp. PA3]|uniref:DUF4132 domain-containing protein n=1 Tax=Streptomonospora sp. PA3 TaxID=2607326 RepID=UPI0012DCE11C|nr:DUF4132 domain-containing protein [Streptomonospora sp. PA3]MUL43029.1 DUF4132 domain-containing protein [Streptomonospora sp. PA3]
MSTPLTWTPATNDYELALDGTTLRCRFRKSGKVVPSVPRGVGDTKVGEKLAALRERLLRHEEECRSTVESWLMGGIPVPAALLGRVWADPAWRCLLENLVVDVDGHTGLLTEVSETGQTTLTGLDGAARTPPRGPVAIPHPVLLPDAAQWREALANRGTEQGVAQLARDTYRRPAYPASGSGVPDPAIDADPDPGATGIDDYAGTEFRELRHATARAARHGFVMRGGYAALRVTGDGTPVEARYWLGADDPGLPAWTGRLLWVDDAQRPLPLGEVGPVAWSEGVRMAELISAGGTNDGQ